MQHMPDKDFDNLFKDKFIDAEIEPSANLWAKIEDQLEPKRKRIFPIYWMAAASVAIAFTAIIVFQKSDKIQLHPDNATVAVTSPIENSAPASVEEVTSSSATQSNVATERNLSPNKVSTSAKMVQSINSENNLRNNEIGLQPNETIAHLPIKKADVKPIDLLPIAIVDNPIVIAQVDPQPKMETDVISETDNITERKGIRNVGDLVNYVVDKVDKRDKKLVRFNTDDDDNSSIIGINIGFLKLNKKNK